MNQKQNKFEEALRNKLFDAEITPPDFAWDNILNELEQKPVSNKKPLFLMRWVAAAVVVLTVGFWLVMDNNSNKFTTVKSLVQKPKFDTFQKPSQPLVAQKVKNGNQYVKNINNKTNIIKADLKLNEQYPKPTEHPFLAKTTYNPLEATATQVEHQNYLGTHPQLLEAVAQKTDDRTVIPTSITPDQDLKNNTNALLASNLETSNNITMLQHFEQKALNALEKWDNGVIEVKKAQPSNPKQLRYRLNLRIAQIEGAINLKNQEN